MARNIVLHFSPDENIWYYQRTTDFKVSKKSYPSKEEALKDYHQTDDPRYEWE